MDPSSVQMPTNGLPRHISSNMWRAAHSNGEVERAVADIFRISLWFLRITLPSAVVNSYEQEATLIWTCASESWPSIRQPDTISWTQRHASSLSIHSDHHSFSFACLWFSCLYALELFHVRNCSRVSGTTDLNFLLINNSEGLYLTDSGVNLYAIRIIFLFQQSFHCPEVSWNHQEETEVVIEDESSGDWY